MILHQELPFTQEQLLVETLNLEKISKSYYKNRVYTFDSRITEVSISSTECRQ